MITFAIDHRVSSFDVVRRRGLLWMVIILGMLAPSGVCQWVTIAQVLPGTTELKLEGDVASHLVSGVDRFLLRQLEESIAHRSQHFKPRLDSHQSYESSLAPNRERLRHILGVRDPRIAFESPSLNLRVGDSGPVGRGEGFLIHEIRWPAVGTVSGEGLLLEPIASDRSSGATISVVTIPDADQTPEQLVGLEPGVPVGSQFARRLAESGCRVVVPFLINREMQRRHSPGRNGGANLSHREFLYRPAYELGRHLIGYELQKVLAAIDWLDRVGSEQSQVGVMGYGEGGMLALYAGAIDTRISAVCISGYFDRRESLWQQPISRNVFGLLEQFGDAELASMIAPRGLVVENAGGPIAQFPSEGGAPARLESPLAASVRAEFERARNLIAGLEPVPQMKLIGASEGAFGSTATLDSLLTILGATNEASEKAHKVELLRPLAGKENRLQRQIDEIDRFTQELLTESPYLRKEFMAELKTDSLDAYEESAAKYRRFFYDEVIGRFDTPVLPFNARSRKTYATETWDGYEVVLDVFPDVIAYGILCVPKGIAENEKRPVVVCQHGLEGRPQDIITGDHRAYHDFAAKLAERGFVTFSPQNLYIFRDRFRSLQRKAYPLKKTLFSIIVPQHQQIVNWLKTLPYTDPGRIAFYGLSYGGKTAMRVPSIITDYCLSICSADFNEWVWKNASTRSPYSYVWTGEYEIFEFDLGSTFNYAEMAALIAPRPFMVERGHFDGVAPDETVAYEFAKVRNLYAARLGVPERCEIEWFAGPHTINGEETYRFLHQHLQWPEER